MPRGSKDDSAANDDTPTNNTDDAAQTNGANEPESSDEHQNGAMPLAMSTVHATHSTATSNGDAESRYSGSDVAKYNIAETTYVGLCCEFFF